MLLLQLLSQLDALRAGLNATAPDECWLSDLEHELSGTLGSLQSHRLLVASPTQLQQYFYLLDAFCHLTDQRPLAQRRQLVAEALLLLESMALEREKTSAHSHEYSWLLPDATSQEEHPAAAAETDGEQAVHQAASGNKS